MKWVLWLSLVLTAPALARPSFTVVDLGPIQTPGAGLYWKGIQCTAENDRPSLAEPGTSAQNDVCAEFAQVAVGESVVSTGNFVSHAALWKENTDKTETVTDLGSLFENSGGTDTDDHSVAYGLNNVGDVVGQSMTSYGTYHSGAPYNADHAFLWNDGVMHDLGTLATNEYNSSAEGVNDSHEVVGTSQAIATADGSILQRAFLYENGRMYDLSFYTDRYRRIRLTDASAIDCHGNISAIGYDLQVNAMHAYLLIRRGPRRTCPP